MLRATHLLCLVGIVAVGCGRTPLLDNNRDQNNALTDDTGDLAELTVHRYGSSSACETSAAELTLNLEVVTNDDGERSLVFRAEGAPLASAHAMLVVSTQPDHEDGIIYNVDPHVDLCLDEGEGLIAPSDATADDVSDAIAGQAPVCAAVSLPFAYATAGIGVLPSGDGTAPPVDGADGDCADGDVFPAGDGCNTCTCVDGIAICTEMACPDRCEDGAFMMDDCNECFCIDGEWACTDMACLACVDGETRMEDCNECFCIDGEWACTDMACEVCADGEIKMEDCNQCVCAGGDWLCTDVACPDYGAPEVVIPYGAGHAFVQMFILCNDHILFEDGPYVEPIFAATDALEVTAR